MLVDATLESLDDAILPSANWDLKLLECSDDIQKAMGELINTTKIQSFQESVAKPYIACLKENVSSRFSPPHKVISAKFRMLILQLPMEMSESRYFLITTANVNQLKQYLERKL